MTRQSGGAFRFRKTDTIGAAGAEEDLEFLSECFVDTGVLSLLKTVTDHRQIILGRAGSGKSALLAKLKWDLGDAVIAIDPENLALTYISNSTILRFFQDLGVNLDPFFKLLWRHVFTVEILTRHFGSTTPVPHESFIDRLLRRFQGTSRQAREMQEAISYLQQWGEKFWEHTEFRVKDITSKLETDLEAGASAGLGIPTAELKAKVKAGLRLSEEQKAELISRGQDIVATAQVKDLANVLTLLDTVLSDDQRAYYIVLDRLDENWVEERLRYKLIMALVNTAKEFFRVRNAKIIIAIRRDLIDRVFRLTRDSGFQEEKYQSLYIPLKWLDHELIEVLDRRVSTLVSRRYTKRPVPYAEFLPRSYNRVPMEEFIGQITVRPRDIIDLFNRCIQAGANLSKLSVAEFREAEGEFSRSRLRALGDEWSGDYPCLLDFTRLLHHRPASFKISQIANTDVGDLCLDVVVENPSGEGLLLKQAISVIDLVTAVSAFKLQLIQVFYRVGIVGLKLKSHEPPSWADEGRSISAAEVDLETSVVIHPAYYRVFGISRPRKH